MEEQVECDLEEQEKEQMEWKVEESEVRRGWKSVECEKVEERLEKC